MGYDNARSPVVRTVHGYPHGSPSEGADMTKKPYRDDLEDLISIVAVAAAMLLVLITAYRCLIRCGAWKKKLAKQNGLGFKWRLLLTFALAAVVASLMSFVFARDELSRGVDTVAESIGDLKQAVRGLHRTNVRMLASCDDITAAAGTLACPSPGPTPTDYLGKIQDVATALTELDAVFYEILEPVELAEDKVETHAQDWVRYIIPGVIGAPFAVIVLLLVLGIACSKKSPSVAACCLDSMTCLSLTVLLPAAVAIFTLVFIVNVVLADFCFLGPDEVIAAKTEKNQYMAYFLQCQGANPLGVGVSDVEGAVFSLFNYTSLLTDAGCSPAGDIATIEIGVYALYNGSLVLDAALNCTYFQPYVEKLMYDAVCGSAVLGLYGTWIVIAAAGSSAYLALIFVPMATTAFLGDKKTYNLRKPFNTPPEEAEFV